MSAKEKLMDFICAFVIFFIVLASIAALAGESFFEGSVTLGDGSATIFGTKFVPDQRFLPLAQKLFYFNDVVFGKGFSENLARMCSFFADYAKDGVGIAYGAARWAVGLS